MAPEQCDPERFSQIGPPAEVWGLGATLFEAVAARQAFPADSLGRFPQLRVETPRVPDKATGGDTNTGGDTGGGDTTD